jgi:UDP-glucose 4-epimerase
VQKINTLPQRYEVFNLGSGTGASVLELIRVFEKATRVKLKFVIGPRRSGDVEKVYANPAKANRLLDWHTELSTEDALRHAWSWQQHLKNLI